jgi:CheY-like chemotaxis protein
MPEQRAAAIAAGCDAIVTKPSVAADLTQTLATHLADR